MPDTDSTCGCKQELRSICKIDAITSIDARGQLVLSKDIRNKLGWNAGDKIAVITLSRGGNPCCVSLIKVDTLSGPIKEFMEPLLK
ncbi:MAG: HgcAB-associated protein HgcC [Candidatus Sigynarchaeota archaeon]